MNPKDIPSKITLTTPEGEFTMEACDCPLCAMEIEVELFEGVWFATSPYAPGLLGTGFCEEEAVGDLVEFLNAIPLN